MEEDAKNAESETSDIDAAEKKSNDSKDVAKPRGAASEERKGGQDSARGGKSLSKPPLLKL